MTNKSKVLVVEDEKDLSSVIVSYFRREGYDVYQSFDGPSAVTTASENLPDLIILDLMLPGFDGVEVCRQIRSFSDAYIMMLTARDEEVDKLVGFAVGADDYVVKPVSPRELIARASAILRRPRSASVTKKDFDDAHGLVFQGIELDPVSRIAKVQGKTMDLTKTEFDLLALLMEDPKRVFSRKSLLDEIWGGEWFGEVQVVDVHIGNLRKKLLQAGSPPNIIRTVRGIGYGMTL